MYLKNLCESSPKESDRKFKKENNSEEWKLTENKDRVNVDQGPKGVLTLEDSFLFVQMVFRCKCEHFILGGLSKKLDSWLKLEFSVKQVFVKSRRSRTKQRQQN